MKSHSFFTTCTNTHATLKIPANIHATFPVTLILKHATQSWPNLRDFYRMHDFRISPHPLCEAEKNLSSARKFLPHPLHLSPHSRKCSLPRWFTAFAITLRTTTKHTQHLHTSPELVCISQICFCSFPQILLLRPLHY